MLITEDPVISVQIPNANNILADKLTALAPTTTGIQYGINKELEIIKQLYDIAALLIYIDNFSEIKTAYDKIVKTELKYRNLDLYPSDVLVDTINTAACIAGRGNTFSENYAELKSGIDSIRNHIFTEIFNGEVAVQRACMVMYIAVAILTNQDKLPVIKDDEYYRSTSIDFGIYNGLKYIRKMDIHGYKYLFEAITMLSFKGDCQAMMLKESKM